MSYNGSGTFVINTAGQPVVSGTVISSTAFNALTADLATGLSTAITKDGQTTPTANIPMGNNKITGLAVGTAATDAANLSQVQSTAAKLVGSVSGVDTITGTMSPTLAAYAAGQMFYFVAAGDNTGAVTLNLDGLGAKAVTRDGSVALAAGDIKSGEVVVVVYDGTRFQVVSQLNSAGNATFANVSITSALNVGGVATFTGGTANGVLYLNGSKVATSGSALVFDGTNLGIGTSSPATKLNLGGSSDQSIQINGSGTAAYVGTSTAVAQISSNRNPTTGAIYDANRAVSYINLEASNGNGNIQFYTTATNNVNATERMRLDSSGNLGLGVTPSAWGAAYRALQVGSRASFVQGASDTYVGNNWINDGANKYIATAAASLYGQSAGVHAWYTAASGTAGNAITFTQAMTLDALATFNQLTLVADGTTKYANYRVTNSSSTGALSLGVGGSSVGATALQNNAYVWNTGNSALSFGTNDTERARITSGGDVGIGTTSPTVALDVYRAAYPEIRTRSASYTNTFGIDTVGGFGVLGSVTNNAFVFTTNNTERARIDSAGNFMVGVTSALGKVSILQGATSNTDTLVLKSPNASGAGSQPGIQFLRDTNAVLAKFYADTNSGALITEVNGSERARITSAGNLLVGTTSELGTNSVNTNSTGATVNGFYSLVSGFAAAFVGVNNTASTVRGVTANTVGFGTADNVAITFGTNNAERARITSGGDLLVGKTTQDAAISGCELRAAGLGVFTASDNNPLVVNRRASDGTLVLFRQDNADEGSISVSGNTVSYNAFAGSHWSQLQDGSKPDILRGTVMESINELCVWPGEENERLPKSKVSDTAGSKKVYGVFMAWDNDWTETNDMYVTAVGAFICRVNGSVTVEEGDLLESNGDGTARVQADDIIRSSTIGKVTSTVKTHQYDDGSYCVPTVLYCG